MQGQLGATLQYLVPISSALALLFAAVTSARIMRHDPGTPAMVEIATAVKVGAKAYLRRQYSAIAVFFIVMFAILVLLARLGFLNTWVPFAFLSGGFFSALAGYIGMSVATSSNSRTTAAARESLNRGLRVAFSSGTVMGITVVGLGLLHISLWYFFLMWFYSGLAEAERLAVVTTTLLTSGMGASLVALFARVGGGIFTKAADVGADLVGKVEAGIPEDDPRNPAVIADNVGDNVGDVAGMGADLYESYVGSIVATSALSVSAGLGIGGVILPMVIAAVGVLASIIGTFVVRTSEKASQGVLLAALRKGVFLSAVLIVAGSYFVVNAITGAVNMGVYYAILSGLFAGIIIGLTTEYFTSAQYRPTRLVSDSGATGPATVIISGLSVGMMSTALPVVIVAIAVMASYYFAGGAGNFAVGLYGIAIAAVGMLSTLGITLATDAYGPVADNAGGIAEMSHQPAEVRQRTDALDSLGNTTAATGKGFAIGSAALTALGLLAAYRDQVLALGQKASSSFSLDLSILNPPVLAGLFIGGALPFFFSSLTMQAVGRAAGKIVVEVRRQFREIKGLMEGKAKPDYARAVDISTRSALREMILPASLAVIVPVAVGLLLGVAAVEGMLAGATVTGFVLAIFMANSGGAWDNAKKHIEDGAHGGKGSPAHKAAVVGDTVGDPFKDTSGPSLNILIKLLSMVSVVFAAFILQYTLLR